MKYFVFAILVIIIGSCASRKKNIYEWRGKDRSGIYQETDLLKEWPADGPEEIWAVEEIGNGFGSPVFVDDLFFITGEIDSMATLFCFNLEGKKQWQSEFGKEWIATFPGSRSAPTIAGDLIYVGTGFGNLYCLEKENGEIVWSTDFDKDFSGIPILNGHSEAAVVKGDKVFWTPGVKEYNVVALDRFTGEVIWSHPGHRERAAYNPSSLIVLAQRTIFVTFSAYQLMGFDTGSGELLWSHEQNSYPLDKRSIGYGDTHANSVIYDNGSIYYAAGDGNRGVKLDLAEDGSEITEVWINPEFNSFMGGIVKIGNYLYGSGNSNRELTALDAATGQLTDSLKIGSGAIIAADDLLYYYNQRGEMKLVSYDQGKLQEISSFKITRGTKQHFSHPVIYRGVLYQRHGQVLMAFDIRKV